MATNPLNDNLDNQPSDWASVPLIATTDRVRGGLDGAANKQAIALTKRVNYLKEQSELNPGNVIEATPKWADVPALNNVNINAQVKVLAERDEYILEQLQESSNNGGSPSQALVSQVQALESQVNNLIEDLEQDGVISLVPSSEWDPVPKLRGESKNVQAQALLNRTELLKDRVDRSVLYFSDYLTAFAAAATLPDGQGIMVEDVKEYYKVQGGNLELIEFFDSSAPASDSPALTESLAGFFRVLGEYPSRPPTANYSYLWTTYGYSYAYPQGFAIDYEANELWVALGTNGGVNNWTWWWVLDLDTKAQKALFYTPTVGQTVEGFSLTREAGTRYLYAPLGGVVAKYALNSLPALYGTISPFASSEAIGTRNIVAKSGDRFLVEVIQRGQQPYKNVFYMLDRSLQVVGTRSIPIYTSGKRSGAGEDGSLLKKQGTASYGGGFAHIYGGLYVGTDYKPMYHDIGAAMADSSGTFTSVARFSAVDMLAYFKSRDPSTSRVEAEGAFINSSGRPMTLIMTNPSDPHSGGMHLVEFYSDRAGAVDMRSSLASMPTVVQTPIWVPERGGRDSDLPLLNPLTGERLDSITKICKYMGETQTNEVRFYTTNFPGIIDNAVGGTLRESAFVTIQSWNNINFELAMKTSDRVFRYMYSLTSDSWTVQPYTIRAANIPGTPGTTIGDVAYARDPSAYNSIGWVWTGSPPKWELFGKIGSGGSGLESGGTVTGTLDMSSAPTDKIKLGTLSLTGSSTYVGFGDSSDPFKVRIYTDGGLTSFGQFLITTGQIRADASYSTTVAESANVNIGAAGYFRRSTSSLRYKDCVEDVEDELMQAVIDEARPIWYRSLCKDDDRDMSWWGLGAEELGVIDPRFVHWAHPIVPTEIVEEIEVQEPTGEIDENGNPITRTVIREERRIENRPDSSQPKQAEGVMYDRLVVPLLWHAKKMQSRIEELEARLAALEPNP